MFAEVSDVVWQALIAAVVTIYLEWSRRKTATEVKGVKTVLENTNAEQGEQFKALGEKVEIVHRATNSMKDELVKVTGESEYAKGVVEGKKGTQP